MKAPVYLYYQMNNYYQNHRRYVKSRNDKQLAGTFYSDTSQLADCDPLRSLNGKVLDPCGLIAYSVFNGASPIRCPCPVRHRGLGCSHVNRCWVAPLTCA